MLEKTLGITESAEKSIKQAAKDQARQTQSSNFNKTVSTFASRAHQTGQSFNGVDGIENGAIMAISDEH